MNVETALIYLTGGKMVERRAPSFFAKRQGKKKLWHEFSRLPAMVLSMCSSFWMLGVESHDFSQAETEITACKAEKIHKMTSIFTQNNIQGLI